MNEIIKNTNNNNIVPDIYLKTIIPLIRDKKTHYEFSWNDTIDYMIERLETMKE